MTRVVVTGTGAVTPAGIGVDVLWRRAMSGSSCVRRIDRFDPSSYRCQVAGQADAFDAKWWLPGRFVKRTDRFTHLAVVAAEMALRDAGLSIGPDGVAPERIAVMVGNVLGGWEFAERELRDLWVHGPREVSPYQATAWFPAAPQGNICIRLGIKGRARTFVGDRASGAHALAHGAETIMRGQADVVIAGGTEQPLSPYAWLCCQTGAFLAPADDTAEPQGAYRPFDRSHGGTVVGEGSAFLILERLEHAQARGAKILAEVTGWAMNTDGYMPYYTSEPHGQTMSKAMTKSLHRAGISVGELGCVLADGSAVPREDAAEVLALKTALGSHASQVPVTAVKAAYGHLLGAATPADAVIAVKMLEKGQIPPIANLSRPAPGFDLDFVVGVPRPAEPLRHVLIVSRGLGGVNACLVLSGHLATNGG